MLYYEAIQSTMSWISCISAQLYDFTFCFFMDFVGILHVLIEQCFFMLCCFYLTILVNLCESICCSFNALFFNIVKWLPWFILNRVSTKLMFFWKTQVVDLRFLAFCFRFMEHLPTELIGNIISRLGPARDVVIASTTCKQWRHAFCYHLSTFSFNSKDSLSYHVTSQFEILISQTLLQSTRLQGLSISMDEVGEFLVSVVISWLMCSKETLRNSLFYNVRTTSNVNILVIYERSKLETLFLAHNSITRGSIPITRGSLGWNPSPWNMSVF